MANPITALQVDEALAGAEAAVSRIGSDLFDLEGDITRRLLDESPLVGKTEVAWKTAGDQVGVLWTWFGALSAHVESCREKRGSGRLKDRELAELGAQLNAPAISLPPESIRLAATCLSGQPLPEPCAVRPLIDVLSSTYRGVADLVARVSQVWDRSLPDLSAIGATLQSAESSAAQAGVRLPNEAAAVRRRVTELRDLIGHDPLSFDQSSLVPLADAAERVRAAVDASVAGRRNLAGDLDALQALIDRAAVDLSQAEARHGEAVTKVAEVASLRAPLAAATAVLERGRATLAELRSLMGSDWEGATRGVRALQQALTGADAEAHRLAVAAGAPLAERQELRGRLDAYRAKAQSVGRGEDLSLESTYRAAQGCLYSSPCDLGEAARLVAQYQAGLRSSPGKDQDR